MKNPKASRLSGASRSGYYYQANPVSYNELFIRSIWELSASRAQFGFSGLK